MLPFRQAWWSTQDGWRGWSSTGLCCRDLEEFVRIRGEIEKLRLMHGAVHGVVFDQLPVAPLHAAHAGLGAAAVHAVHHIAHGGLFAFEHGFEAEAFIALRCWNAGDVAKRGHDVEQVEIFPGTREPGLMPGL